MDTIADALQFAFGMTWEVLWALILGFALSSGVQAVVSKQQMRRLLLDDSPRTLTVAAELGAASSSCSYASVALARSLFRKGADFTAEPLRFRQERRRGMARAQRSREARARPCRAAARARSARSSSTVASCDWPLLE